jgi:hypothetical protein
MVLAPFRARAEVDNLAAGRPKCSDMPRRVPIPVCCHCNKPLGHRVRRRGLCSACYDDLTIRSQYAAQAVGRAAPGVSQEFAGPASAEAD